MSLAGWRRAFGGSTSAAGRRLPMLAIQTIAAPVFHGHGFSIAVELERPVDISALEEAMSGEHVDLVLEETDSPSNLAATGQNDVLVRLRLEPGARNANESRVCGCGRLRTTCGCTRRTRWSARWICAGFGRRGRCSRFCRSFQSIF